MSYRAKTKMELPVMEDKEVFPGVVRPVPTGEATVKMPGDTITAKEFADHGQGKEQIEGFVKYGSVEEV